MLTTKQYKFLKKVSKNDISCDDLHQNRDRIYLYLLERKFIEIYNVCPDGDVLQKNAKLYCKATESGKIEILLCRQERYHFWIPTMLSILAIAISGLAIFTQNVELWQLLKELLK